MGTAEALQQTFKHRLQPSHLSAVRILGIHLCFRGRLVGNRGIAVDRIATHRATSFFFFCAANSFSVKIPVSRSFASSSSNEHNGRLLLSFEWAKTAASINQR